ncbi:MAG: capsid cement protein [Brevinema sp.]
MIHISIWTRTATANQDTVEKRFVDPHGRYGGYQGVSMQTVQEGTLLSVLTIGEAEVELAEGQSITVGDLVIGDNQGRAKKSTDTGAYVLEVNQNFVKVVIR